MANESEFIQYTVQPGDSFWGLVEEYDTTAEDIMADNPGLDPNNMQIGEMVLLQPYRRGYRRPYYRPYYHPYYHPYHYPPYYYHPYPYYPHHYRR